MSSLSKSIALMLVDDSIRSFAFSKTFFSAIDSLSPDLADLETFSNLLLIVSKSFS